jgi:hypothetical protein
MVEFTFEEPDALRSNSYGDGDGCDREEASSEFVLAGGAAVEMTQHRIDATSDDSSQSREWNEMGCQGLN